MTKYKENFTKKLSKILKTYSFLWQVYILGGVDKSDVWPWWTALWRGGNHPTHDDDVGDDDYDDDNDDDNDGDDDDDDDDDDDNASLKRR